MPFLLLLSFACMPASTTEKKRLISISFLGKKIFASLGQSFFFQHWAARLCLILSTARFVHQCACAVHATGIRVSLLLTCCHALRLTCTFYAAFLVGHLQLTSGPFSCDMCVTIGVWGVLGLHAYFVLSSPNREVNNQMCSALIVGFID